MSNNSNFDNIKKEILNSNLPGSSIINPFYYGSNNLNKNVNNNNNYMSNPLFKLDDDHEQNEKSIDKELNTFTTDIKGLRQLGKINNKDKHNLLKIVNMYMKDDKKAQSKMKISGILKTAKNKKSNFEKKNKQFLFWKTLKENFNF